MFSIQKYYKRRRNYSMKRVIKWGILSTASIAQKAIIPALQASENSEVYAIASESNKSKQAAETFNILKAYDSYMELLEDPDIEAVYIPLPNSLHKKWVIEAAKKGKHILCEKPAALNSADLREMEKACVENNVLFMEAYMYQFHPQHQRVKEIIASGEIGNVKHMTATFTFQLDLNTRDIRINPELGGGSIFDIGCYCIHASLYLLNQQPKEVYVSGDIPSNVGVDLTATGLLTFDNGITAGFHCSFDEPMSHHYEIFGTKGAIRVPFAFRPDLRDGEGIISVTNENGEMRQESVYGDQYLLQVEHFSTCILEQRPIYTGEQSNQNLSIIEACYQSLRTKKPVIIEKK